MYVINKTKIDGCIELIPQIFADHRGISIKPYHREAFKQLGIDCSFNEDLMVTSNKSVLRGLHYQTPPLQQAKLIYCVSGSIFDVAVDIRTDSPTYGRHMFCYIDTKKHNLLYIPSGFAHGYLVLEDNTTVIYKMSSVYSPAHEAGIRWDSVEIHWPLNTPILSEKDKTLPTFPNFFSVF